MSSFNENSGSSPSGTSVTDRASDAFDTAKQTVTEQAQKVTDEAKKVAQSATETVKSAAADLTSEAGKLAGDAAQRARSFADENKGKVAEQVDSLAGVLNKAADELEGSNQAMFAGYARQLAGGVQTVSTTLREKGVDELFTLVGDFARKQPALFIGGAALLGFAASRLAVASAKSGRYASDNNWGTETDQNNWAANRSGSPEIREPWSGDEGGSTGTSAWGDNQGAGGSTGSYGGGSTTGYSSGSAGGSYGSGANDTGTGTNGQWNSTRDSEGGTI